MRKMLQNKVLLVIIALTVAGAVVFPFVNVDAGRDQLYVDNSYKGDQEDGSASKPYRKISKALDKADGDTDIHIAAGTYKENIKIPKNVKLFGNDKGKVIIDGDRDEPTVRMRHKTLISKITVKGGEQAIYVEGSSKASIIECIVKDAKKDGVRIDDSKHVKDSYMVSISHSTIVNNDGSGVYAEKSRLSITDSFVSENGKDGIDIGAGSRVWLDDNTVKKNGGSGIKVVLDSSDIWMKKMSVHDNKREGMEVSVYGSQGRIDVDRSKFYEIGRYGIARVSRGAAPVSLWGGLTVSANTQYWGNGMGTLSGVVRVR